MSIIFGRRQQHGTNGAILTGDPRTGDQLEREKERLYACIREEDSKHSIRTYELWDAVERIRMEMARRRYQDEATRAWMSGRDTLAPRLGGVPSGPISGPLGGGMMSGPLEDNGRMKFDG